MTDEQFTILCGMIVRGTSLPTACDMMDLDLREVMDETSNDPKLLCDLYSALTVRAHALGITIEGEQQPQ
jgi:hypothetical protein